MQSLSPCRVTATINELLHVVFVIVPILWISIGHYMQEVRTTFLYQVQGEADFQHCEALKVVKLTVMTVSDDRRLSIEVLGAVGMPSILITGLTLCLLYGSLCLVGLNLVLGLDASRVLSQRTGQNLRSGLSSSRTDKVRVLVGTYIVH